jgi:3-oxoacyl-[acyl-carrier protein] reductase
VAELDGQVAVVTGAGRGIGRGIACGLAAAGAHVVVVDRPVDERAHETVASIARAGGRATAIAADVTDEAATQRMVEEAIAAVGQIDVLVNNAGVSDHVPFAEMTVAAWDRIMAVNLRGVFLCTRYVVPHMVERGSGKIINIASQLGQIGGAEMVHYSASKGGVIGFTKALARELAPAGILVNAIAPGPINTYAENEPSDDWLERKLAELPIGRFGEIDEVVPTAVFLASERASYYVGQVLGPNGGDAM